MSNFQPLEVVVRGSETQLQVGENFNKLREGLKRKFLQFVVYLNCTQPYFDTWWWRTDLWN